MRYLIIIVLLVIGGCTRLIVVDNGGEKDCRTVSLQFLWYLDITTNKCEKENGLVQ